MLRGTTSAATGTDQPLSGKLTAIADIGASTGVILNTGASTAEVRALGVAAGTSIPTVTDADTRYLRWYTALPGAGVGTNGDYGVLYASGYPAVLILKTAGAWAVVDTAMTFANMLAIGSPVSGMVVNVSTITFAGDAGTQTVNTPFRYDGSQWKPIYEFACITAVDTAQVPNSSTGFLNLYTFGFPASMIYAGMGIEIDTWIRSSNTADADTATPVMRKHDATTTLLTMSAAATAGHVRGEYHGFGASANVIQWPGASSAGSSYTGAATTVDSVASDTANGSNLHRIGFTGSAADSTKSWDLEFLKVIIKP